MRRREPLTRQMLGGTIPERFHSKVAVGSSDECWEWTACVKSNGYGEMVLWRGRGEAAHRIAWVLEFGDIPAGMCICHECDNKTCCNPSHMFLGTHKDNMEDMVSKGRHNPVFGQRSDKALTTRLVMIAKQMRAAGAKQTDIAAHIGASQSWVSEVLRGKLRPNG